MSRYLERRIVTDLCAHLAAAGFAIESVYDGEETSKVVDAEGAMKLIFDLDEAWLHVCKPEFTEHGILLVLGNGADVIADWNYRKGDPDSFNAATEAFDTERYA